MSQDSAIEWTDSTWNPVRGCTKVSPGCTHCYAETFAERFRGVPGHPYEQGFDLRLVPERLDEPLRWKKPRRVFVNSMSDLFQDGVPDSYIDQVFAIMALARQHTFQVLTKRPDRMLRYCTSIGSDVGEHEPDLDGEALRDAMIEGQAQRLFVERGGSNHAADYLAVHQPLPNVWLGVSVENQHFADERIPLLLQTPAAVRFISAEPLLEAIDLGNIQLPGHPATFDALSCYDNERDEPLLQGACLDWVIVGGESGHGARPFDLAWARSIIAQCQSAGVACFVKQLGAQPYNGGNLYEHQALTAIDLKSKKGGDMSEWPADLRVREFPNLGHSQPADAREKVSR